MHGANGVMNACISRGLLILCIAAVASSRLVSTIPGDRWPWYVVGGLFAIGALVLGTARMRRSAVGALVICAILIADDVSAGRKARDLQGKSVPNQRLQAPPA